MNALTANFSSLLQNAHVAALLLDTLLKSFVVLALAGGVCVLWRRASAATRHLLWLLAVASLPFLPLLNSTPTWQRPAWTISTGFGAGNQISLALELAPHTIAQKSAAAPTIGETSGANQNAAGNGRKVAAQFSANWLAVGFAAWLAGAALVLISVTVGQFRLRQFSRNAQPLGDADWTRMLAEARETLRLRRAVTLLQSPDDVVPLTWGWWRPVILLPAEAARWPAERRRIVLLHELAHVKRCDCLTQLATQIVCAIYWFNPLVWLAARQMRVEREWACDDLVLAGGCKASDYAGHLVDIAGSFRRVPLAAAIAMARSSQLAGRVAAIVDTTRNRRLRAASAIAILALIGGFAVCIGGSGTSPVGSVDKSNSLRQQQIERLKAFSAEKEKQSQTLAAAAGETISPEYEKFFKAATSGDWQTVTNMYESFKRRHPQYGHPHQHSDVGLRTSFWQPVLEISLAYDHVVNCEPACTQMAVDGIVNSIPAGSIYFGGTDPGRGLPTAFCKSHVDADPFYTLTQNALADGTYLEYLQRTYGNEKAWLAKLAEARQSDAQLRTWDAEWPATVQKLDSLDLNADDPDYKAAQEAVNDLSQKREERAKTLLAEVQGQATAQTADDSKLIYIPTAADSQRCFEDYTQDITRRAEKNQLKPGEGFHKDDNGRIQISGQVSVMQINGLLVKLLLDKNSKRDCYIEESFSFDWMYPQLEPHGLIFKLNRQPLGRLSNDSIEQDHQYWTKEVKPMIGDWLKDDTSVSEVAAFVEKVFQRHDLSGFKGDPRFVQNDYASKMFSKLRVSIAGLYMWRMQNTSDKDDKQRMTREADFAFRQAWALCPYSPEALYRYVNCLLIQNRLSDALLVAETTAKMPGLTDESARQMHSLIDNLKQFQKQKHNEAEVRPVNNREGKSVFQVRLVLDTPTDDSEPMTNEWQAASTARTRTKEVLQLQKTVLLDQSALKSAKVVKDALGLPQIDIRFTDAGRKRFAEITRQHLHERLAMVIDGKLLSAPVIQSEIPSGEAIITGNFSEAEANALAAKINAAAGK